MRISLCAFQFIVRDGVIVGLPFWLWDSPAKCEAVTWFHLISHAHQPIRDSHFGAGRGGVASVEEGLLPGHGRWRVSETSGLAAVDSSTRGTRMFGTEAITWSPWPRDFWSNMVIRLLTSAWDWRILRGYKNDLYFSFFGYTVTMIYPYIILVLHLRNHSGPPWQRW